MKHDDIDRIATLFEVPLWCVEAAAELGYHGDSVIGHVASVIAMREALARVEHPVEWEDTEHPPFVGGVGGMVEES